MVKLGNRLKPLSKALLVTREFLKLTRCPMDGGDVFWKDSPCSPADKTANVCINPETVKSYFALLTDTLEERNLMAKYTMSMKPACLSTIVHQRCSQREDARTPDERETGQLEWQLVGGTLASSLDVQVIVCS